MRIKEIYELIINKNVLRLKLIQQKKRP